MGTKIHSQADTYYLIKDTVLRLQVTLYFARSIGYLPYKHFTGSKLVHYLTGQVCGAIHCDYSTGLHKKYENGEHCGPNKQEITKSLFKNCGIPTRFV